jgi:hypothetical protein
MTELEDQVIALLVEETGIERKRVQLASRLADDIGIEGDDAVEFFEKFGEKFHVDLTVLYDHWHRHFLPEGLGIPPLWCLIVIGAGVTLGGLVHEAVNRIPAWASTIALTALFWWVFGWVYSKFFSDEPYGNKVPITMQDLVDAATSGQWVKHYEEPVG